MNTPETESRNRHAAAQAALLGALVRGAPVPQGFDDGRVRTTAAALHRKRAGAVASSWPALSASLNSEFVRLFRLFAYESPLPRNGSPHSDGRAFARWLRRRQPLSAPATIELAASTLRFVETPAGLRLRRIPSLMFAVLRQPLRLVVALRVPPLRERWFTLGR